MDPRVYDISLAAGTVSVGVGAGLAYGLGFGLIAFGATVIVNTIASVLLLARRR
jgi:hypothetical protein